MTDQDTATVAAQDQVTEPPVVEPAPVEEPKFSSAQLQQLQSMLGRIVANQLEEKVIPTIKTEGGGQTQDELKEKREKWLEKIFEGRIDEVVDEVDTIRNKKNLNKTQQLAVMTKKALTKFNEDPFYKDVYSESEKLAGQYLAKGYPPDAAAEIAFTKAKANHLEQNATNTDELKMTSAGKRPPEPKKPKVPAQFKKAMERDISQGLYKDEADWISGLSPQIRARHGL